jgi:hypothetical protein
MSSRRTFLATVAAFLAGFLPFRSRVKAALPDVLEIDQGGNVKPFDPLASAQLEIPLRSENDLEIAHLLVKERWMQSETGCRLLCWFGDTTDGGTGLKITIRKMWR